MDTLITLPNVAFTTFNRTSMELKQFYALLFNLIERVSFNRTSMELKHFLHRQQIFGVKIF